MLDLFLSAKGGVSSDDRVDRIWFGSARLMAFNDLIFVPGHTRYSFVIMWDQDHSYEHFLRVETARRQIENPDVNLSVWRSEHDGLAPVAPSRHQRFAAQFARAGRQYRVLRQTSVAGDPVLVLARPSAVPGFICVAAASLAPVETEVRREMARLFGLAAICLLLMIGVGRVLSDWLAVPVARMSEGLRRIAEGDLTVSVVEPRLDELGTASLALADMTAALRERGQLTRFVAPQVLEVVAGGDMTRAMSGARRDVVVLVCDVRGFTTLTERMPPAHLFAALNEYLAAGTAAVQRAQGVVDRFIGDAIVAVFPVGDAGPRAAVRRAVGAALELMTAHHARQAARAANGEPTFRIGVGIDVGAATAGVIGDPAVRLDYTVLGDVVNRAMALETSSKQGTTSRIVVATAVRDALGVEFRCRALARNAGLGGAGDTLAQAWELTEWPLSTAVSWRDWFVIAEAAATPDAVPVDRSEGEVAVVVAPPGPADSMSSPAVPVPATAGAMAVEPVKKDIQRIASVVPVGARSGVDRYTLMPWRQVVLAIVWLLPLGVVWTAIDNLGEARARVRLQRAEQQAGDDLTWLQRSSEAQPQLNMLIRQLVADSMNGIRTAPDPARAAQVGLAYRLRQLEQSVRGFAWAVGPVPPIPVATDPASFSWACLDAGGTFVPPDFADMATGLAFGLPETLAGVWSRGSRMDSYPVGFSSAHPVRRWHETLFPISIGNFCKVGGAGMGRSVLVLPLMKPGWREDAAVMALASAGWAAPRAAFPRVLAEQALGLVVVSVSQFDRWPASTTWALAEHNLRRRGGRGWVETVAGRRAHTRGLANLLPGLSYGASARARIALGRDGLPARVVLTGEMVSDRNFRAVVARPVPRPDVAEKALRGLAVVVPIAWIGLGLALVAALRTLGTSRPGGGARHWSLRNQLVAAFLVTLLPGFVFGVQLLERDLATSETRILTEERDLLLAQLAKFEDGVRIYDVWNVHLLSRLLRDPRFLEELHAAKAQTRRVEAAAMGLRLGAAPHSGLVTLTDRSRRFGVPPRSIQLADRLGQGTCCPFARSDDALMAEAMQLRFIGAFLTVLAGLGETTVPGETPAAQAMLEGEVDNFMSISSQFMSPELAAHFFNADRHVGRAVLAEAGAAGSFMQIRLASRRVPMHLSQVQWHPNIAWAHHLLAWRAAAHAGETTPPGLAVWMAERLNPYWVLDYPYFGLAFHQEENLHGLTAAYRPGTPDLVEAATLAAMSGEGVARLLGDTEALRWLVAMPGRLYPNRVLLAEAPVGERLALARRNVMVLRGFLAALLGLGVALAFGVARRFLAPVLALADAAGQIAVGNFAVRLHATGAGEIVTLAAAFNRMAAGVAEGRLLGRFVPEAALESARRDAGSLASGAGQGLEAVVMFVGLAGFKDLLATTDPAVLVRGLNDHLARCSRVIRDHGGQIDKFIGEKLLAVFRVADGVAPGPVIARAASAAEQLRVLARGTHSPANPGSTEAGAGGVGLSLPLGVGLVAGRVLEGTLGSAEVRLEFTVIGDTVNLASRLSDLALQLPGAGIVVDGVVADGIRKQDDVLRVARLHRLEVHQVKGKVRAVEIYQLLDASPATGTGGAVGN